MTRALHSCRCALLPSYDRNTIVTIAGGTIFNAGAEGGDPAEGMCNGIVINAGRLSTDTPSCTAGVPVYAHLRCPRSTTKGRVTLNGVLIRNNKGKGLWAPSGHAKHLLVSGCQLFENGQVGGTQRRGVAADPPPPASLGRRPSACSLAGPRCGRTSIS